MTTAGTPVRSVRAFEPWMLSNVATGAATASFLNLLVPPFVTDVTGSAARSGLVFALISVSALSGPWFGARADRTGQHRLYYLIALTVMSTSFALLALDAAVSRWSPLFAIVLGASYSAQGTIGPTFIVGAGLSHADVAKQLTAFNLAYPAGQLAGAVLVAIAQAAGLSTAAVFLSASAVLLVLTLASWPALAVPAKRLATAQHATAPSTTTDNMDRPQPARSGTAAMLRSAFGAFLLVVALSSVGNNGMTSQLANLMPHVYGFSASATSLLLGAAGLINIPVIILTGMWLARRPALNVYAAGTALRAAGALAMALVGLMTSPVLVLAAIFMLITYQGVAIPRVAASDLAVELSPTGPAQAGGLYFAASALGAVVGCLGAGILADSANFNAVNWMAAVFGVAATLTVLPLLRSRRAPAPSPP